MLADFLYFADLRGSIHLSVKLSVKCDHAHPELPVSRRKSRMIL